MVIWLLFLLMTAIAIAAVLWPLSRKPRAAADGNDVAVYRDQLDEIERDRALGTIGVDEADAARNEVSRRLLAAADAAASTPAAPPADQRTGQHRAVGLAILVVIPLLAAAFYLPLGSPGLPFQPLAGRIAKAHTGMPVGEPTQGQQGQSVEALVARVETYLEQNPEDGRGWEVVAPVYMRIGNFAAAAKARANALRLLGSTAARESDLGEALVAAADGAVTAEAKAAFDRAVKLDPADVSSRFYLALAALHDGRTDEAVTRWQALLADAPADAPWADSVRRAIARAQGKPSPDDTSQADEHPTANERMTTADIAKAFGLAPPAGAAASAPAAPAPAPPPAQAAENEMVKGMVARLAERLKQDGSDVEGWLRLVRAYVVLGEPDKARAAAADARAALKADPGKLRDLDTVVKQLGLEG